MILKKREEVIYMAMSKQAAGRRGGKKRAEMHRKRVMWGKNGAEAKKRRKQDAGS